MTDYMAERITEAAIAVPGPNTLRGHRTVLSVSPKDGDMFAYGSKKMVVIRSVRTVGKSLIECSHKAPVRVARFNKQGNWIASGDETGMLRVWAWEREDRLLKKETRPVAGQITDVQWDSDTKRIAVVGKSRGCKGKVVGWDTGSAMGELTQHTKPVNCCAFRQSRPFRVATGGEDTNVILHQGPPFKVLLRNKKGHKNYVNSVVYAPDDSIFATASSDTRIRVWDGKSGEKLKQMAFKGENPGHTGSVMDLCFSEDGKTIISCGSDKKVCFYDVESRACLREFLLRDKSTVAADPDGKPQVHHQCVSIALAGDKLLVGSLGGDINILEAADGTFVDTLYSHRGIVSNDSLVMASDGKTMFTADYEGSLFSWDISAGELVPVRCAGIADPADSRHAHAGPVAGLAPLAGGRMLSVGLDDICRVWNGTTAVGSGDKLGGQPRTLDTIGPSSSASLALCATSKQVLLTLNSEGKIVAKYDLGFNPGKAVAINPNGTEVSISVNERGPGLVRRFKLNNGNIGTELPEIVGNPDYDEEAFDMQYSPDGTQIAVGWGKGEVSVYEAGDSGKAVVEGLWVKHRGAATSIAWSPSGKYVASGSLDDDIILWNIAAPKDVKARCRHEDTHVGGVRRLLWLDEKNLVSAGGDLCVRRWTIGEDNGK